MRDVAVLSGGRHRPAPPPRVSAWRSGDLPEVVRHLVIDGYDQPARRWALRRCQRGVNALYCAGGLFAAAVLTSVIRSSGGLGVLDAMTALSAVETVAAVLILVYSMSRILPILAASAYAKRWTEHMPVEMAAPRYARLYAASCRSTGNVAPSTVSTPY